MHDKQAVVTDIHAAYQEFMDSVDGLSDEQLDKAFMESWGVREVAGHLIGWQEQMTTGFERMARGERPTPEGVNWTDVQAWNDQFAAGVKDRNGAELVKELDSRTERMITALEALPDDRFGEGKTTNRMAAAAAYEHLREHAAEIKAARESGQL